jgi:hypothetical protein
MKKKAVGKVEALFFVSGNSTLNSRSPKLKAPISSSNQLLKKGISGREATSLLGGRLPGGPQGLLWPKTAPMTFCSTPELADALSTLTRRSAPPVDGSRFCLLVGWASFRWCDGRVCRWGLRADCAIGSKGVPMQGQNRWGSFPTHNKKASGDARARLVMTRKKHSLGGYVSFALSTRLFLSCHSQYILIFNYLGRPQHQRANYPTVPSQPRAH